MPDAPGWIVDSLIDAFEPAALDAARVAEDRRKPASRANRQAEDNPE
ncbi:hypothetical protein [Brevundimonas subvibrioides]|uniref:Uncharacterized protein n=1 Tax=Brevundimonas subvibrioides (strain ATCC 15264 / DSM 4735 / LMG 14903 / NBRC 16000 / CB 81) TaxID=633149 RepID=D9QFY7_BRESC|nr:hypothetical protein [Brevundimonas subvibrioides]ADL00701.1 hypothetical protein Bresu_1389 [Brevundimonas subvibrioides ATCC 15264]